MIATKLIEIKLAEIEVKLAEIERAEREAFSNFSQCCSEEHALQMEIAYAVSQRQFQNINEIEKELEPITLRRIDLEEKYLHAKITTAKAIKESVVIQYRDESPSAFDQLIAPMFDKSIWEAEYALNLHLNKYEKL